MTAIWGPLGWMTLHSVAHNYPTAPSPQEEQLVTQWLNLFRETITCPTCKGHFTEMLEQYRAANPRFLASRRDFLLFTYRAHNTVNRRLDKPVYLTSPECEAVYRRNIEARSARAYRVAYLNHIMRHWQSMRDAMGIIAVKQVREMMRVETEYWSLRETGPMEDMEAHSTAPLVRAQAREVRPFAPVNRPAFIGFRGGRFQFRR
jgi:hypothetical protein